MDQHLAWSPCSENPHFPDFPDFPQRELPSGEKRDKPRQDYWQHQKFERLKAPVWELWPGEIKFALKGCRHSLTKFDQVSSNSLDLPHHWFHSGRKIFGGKTSPRFMCALINFMAPQAQTWPGIFRGCRNPAHKSELFKASCSFSRASPAAAPVDAESPRNRFFFNYDSGCWLDGYETGPR